MTVASTPHHNIGADIDSENEVYGGGESNASFPSTLRLRPEVYCSVRDKQVALSKNKEHDVEHRVQTMVWPKMGRRESTSRVRPGRRLDCSSTMSESINIGMIKS